jgi:hypothetical protein
VHEAAAALDVPLAALLVAAVLSVIGPGDRVVIGVDGARSWRLWARLSKYRTARSENFRSV